jgi:uncharacterized membrane protein
MPAGNEPPAVPESVSTPAPVHASTTGAPEVDTQFERVIFFSDAVFAIAITLLVIDIRLPDVAGHARPLDVLNALTPQILAFALSFIVVGRYWVSHHSMFGQIRGFDGRLITLNLLLLLFIAFVPFPTSFLGAYGNDPSGPVVYALTNAGASGSLALIWWYASLNGLTVPGLDPRYVRYVTWRMLRTSFVFLLSIPVAVYVSPTLAEFSWALISPVGLVLHRVYGEAADFRPRRSAG